LLTSPEIIIDLKGIPGLDYVAYDEGKGLRIGALASIYSVAHHPSVKEKFGILSRAADSIAANQIQQRGTIAGNICNAVPSADSAPALLCLGATLSCVKKGAERTIHIDDFFRGPNETVLEPGELLKEIRIPEMPEGGRGTYFKLSTRSRMDLAVVGVGALVSTENGRFKDVRIALGAVAPTPMRATKAEDLLKGEKISDEIISKASQMASEESKPIDDHRASAEYRKMMVEVLVRRAIGQATKE
ncbi:MAG: xanthine dehydrogenase family protein subunit M, partial [Deltaproteobacteria bacterium]|nr:xanthine dehydrogenase family protein subunit M [Deltaproteobacteria bacterium]